jgi:membrane protease YdiL (CAAX protease family)
VYLILLIAQVGNEVLLAAIGISGRLPKNLVVWGTAVAWYVGIVYYDADIPFTLTNVVAHGVPYITLIWLFTARDATAQKSEQLEHRSVSVEEFLFHPRSLSRKILGVSAFLSLIIALAYIEELLWDSMVWRDHGMFFDWAWWMPHLTSHEVLQLIVPLLAVPQATHYVLDAFIWRIRKRTSTDERVLFV